MDYISFPPQSNRASWRQNAEIIDYDNNLFDLTGFSIVFQIQDKDGTDVLQASTTNGKITLITPGIFQWFFTVVEMRNLYEAGTYQTGLTITTPDGTETQQLGVGPLPIVDGIVP